MRYDPIKHHRRSIRLKGYDYSQPGAYAVTICVQGRFCIWGEIESGEMLLSPAGKMVQGVWLQLPARFPTVDLDAAVIMPNHFHGILLLSDRTPTTGQRPKLSEVVGAVKSITTHQYIQGVKGKGWQPFPGRLWQRNYYEHIVRDTADMNRIRQYIANNPSLWLQDSLHPDAPPMSKTGRS